MVMVDGHAVTAAFRSDQLLLLLHPAVHVVIGDLGPPPSQGLRRPLGRPRAAGAVAAVPGRPVPEPAAVLSQQGRRSEAAL